MRNSIIFDGVDFAAYGAYVAGQNVYNSPVREYKSVTVPGRNGDLMLDRGRYKNITRSYGIIFADDFRSNIWTLRNILATRTGYRRLEDTYHPDEFYIACYNSSVNAAYPIHGDAGKFTVSFTCKPQRFLKSGEAWQEFDANGIIVNPAQTVALPIVRIYIDSNSDAATVKINDTEIDVDFTSISDHVELDCELQEAYRIISGKVRSRNAYVTLDDGEFFSLLPGENSVKLVSGVARVEIMPRWWIV